MSKLKTSIRLSLTDDLRYGLDILRRTRYPFLKDDEIFKLGFSKLFARESITSNRETSVANILSQLQSLDPDFGREWLEKHQINIEDMDVKLFCEMILELKKTK